MGGGSQQANTSAIAGNQLTPKKYRSFAMELHFSFVFACSPPPPPPFLFLLSIPVVFKGMMNNGVRVDLICSLRVCGIVHQTPPKRRVSLSWLIFVDYFPRLVIWSTASRSCFPACEHASILDMKETIKIDYSYARAKRLSNLFGSEEFNMFQKSERRVIASVLKQDPNTQKVQKNVVY